MTPIAQLRDDDPFTSYLSGVDPSDPSHRVRMLAVDVWQSDATVSVHAGVNGIYVWTTSLDDLVGALTDVRAVSMDVLGNGIEYHVRLRPR